MNSNPLSYVQFIVLLFSVVGIYDDCHLLSRNSRYVCTINAYTVHYQLIHTRSCGGSTAGSSSSTIVALRSSSSSTGSSTNSSSSSSITAKRPPRPSPTGFSFVEDGVYTNIEEEIEAMGGDPFFLSEGPTTPPTRSTDAVDTTSSDASSVTDTWEWDGVEVDDAYFDE